MKKPIQTKPPVLARIHYRDGRVVEFTNQTLAYQIWLALPRGVRAAFRGKGDSRPVYPWDYADKA